MAGAAKSSLESTNAIPSNGESSSAPASAMNAATTFANGIGATAVKDAATDGIAAAAAGVKARWLFTQL